MTKFLKLALHLLIAAAIMLPTNLLAQKYKELKERMDYVFEGEIVKSTGKWNTGKTMVYTEHEIRLTKVFKGDLREKEIKLVTIGGETETDFVIAGDALQLQECYKGIFFAQENPLGMLAETAFNEKTCFSNDPNGFVKKTFNDRNPFPLGYGALYQKEKYDKVLSELGQVLFEYPEVAQENPLLEIGCNDTAYQSSAEITFENIGVTGNFENVELDIMIKGLPQGVKFGKCEFSLTFPTSTFGQYLVQNNLLNVTKGDVAQSTDYTLTVIDEEANKVKITVVLSSGSLVSPYALDGSVEKLLHCSFGVYNPSGLPHLKASDFTLTGNVWYECDRSLVPFRNIIIKTEGDVITPNFESLIGINCHLQKFHLTTIAGSPFLRFDIYANSGNLSLYRTSELYIDFSPTAFTSPIGPILSVTKGELISGTTDVGGNPEPNYNVSDASQGSNSIKITISPNPNVGDAGLALLTNEPVQLLSVLVKVDDCMEDADIQWNDLTNNTNHTYLEGSDIFQYLPVTYTGGLTTPMCGCNLADPEITGFSEAQVRAGVGERLTIEGDNFGDVIVDGSCFIQVRDGDGTGDTQIPLIDIIDWTNTAITFIVPSTTVGKINGPMASGGVKVFTECDDSNEEDMDVEYAVMNYRPNINVRAFRLALEKQTNNGIVFKFSSNVGGDERTLTTEAIETWCNTTGIHWSHGETLQNYTQVSPTDGINLVVEIPTNQLPTAAAAAAIVAGNTTPSYQDVCNNGKTYYVQNIDIVIDQGSNFDVFDASDQRIFLHEFGHAHMLNHAARLGTSGSQKLMYYTYDFSGAITTADLNGANTVFPASAALLSGGDCPDPIDTHVCTNPTSENVLEVGIKVSPIPFTDNFVIRNEQPLTKGTTIVMYGATGRKILERQYDMLETIQVNGLESLPSGVYFLHIFTDDQYWSGKLIKSQSHE